jgi:peptidyl-tRNA hydrolase, PTH1 family
MEALYLIVGLGNPGSEYARTRHNIGFMAVERFGERHRAGWSMEKRFESRVSKVDCSRKRALLCEPQTFMNVSGRAVGALVDFYRTPLDRLLVVVDDADLPFGELRMRPSGSSGGHHGLESIEQRLGTREYARLRMGIGRQRQEVREITGHVLGKFGAAEAATLELMLDRAARQMERWMEAGLQRAMNEFNGAVNAPATKDEK